MDFDPNNRTGNGEGHPSPVAARLTPKSPALKRATTINTKKSELNYGYFVAEKEFQKNDESLNYSTFREFLRWRQPIDHNSEGGDQNYSFIHS